MEAVGFKYSSNSEVGKITIPSRSSSSLLLLLQRRSQDPFHPTLTYPVSMNSSQASRLPNLTKNFPKEFSLSPPRYFISRPIQFLFSDHRKDEVHDYHRLLGSCPGCLSYSINRSPQPRVQESHLR